MSAEQQTSVANIRAGGDVNVSPTQIVVVQGAASEREWAEALLRGPVEAVGQAEELAGARELARDGQHGEAAESLARVVASLRGQGYDSVADAYREQQALQLEADQQHSAAVSAALAVARSRLARDDERSLASAQLVARLVSADEQWIAAALQICCAWPEVPSGEADALDEAAARAGGREDETWWVARAVERHVLEGNLTRVLEVAGAVRERVAIAGGARLDLELDYLDAVEPVHGVEQAEGAWQELLRWATDLSACAPADSARVLQRRAVGLTARGELEEVRRVSLQAIEAWSRVPGHEDQGGEAFFSYRLARQLLGAPLINDSEVAQVAAELRGTAGSAAVLADRLELGGLHARLEDNRAECRRQLTLALRQHRRAGNLRGQFAAAVGLAELHESSGLHEAALALRIEWGQLKEVERLAPLVPAEHVASMVRLRAPEWVRAASYTALVPHLRVLPPELSEAFARAMLDEAEGNPSTPWGSDPVYRARTAACGVVLSEEPSLRARAIALASRLLKSGTLEHRRAAAAGLLMATQAGLVDASSELVEDYLDEDGSYALPSPQVSDLAEGRPQLVERLDGAARAGSIRALEALAVGDLIAGDAALGARCDAFVSAGLTSSNHSEQEAEGVVTRSIGLFVFEGYGLIGRACTESIRAELTRKLVTTMGDPVDIEPNRASAANALLNLAPAIPAEEVSDAVNQLEPLALGRYAPSRWDREHLDSLHPYSRNRFDIVLPDALRAAALRTIGRLVVRSILARPIGYRTSSNRRCSPAARR